jgi:outer membrane protein assembly factor BamB
MHNFSQIHLVSKRPILFLLALMLCSSMNIQADTGDWPGFRGPNFDGSAPAGSKFEIADGGSLNVVWRSKIGAGYSGVSIVGNRAVTMFSDGTSDVAAAFDITNGKELWRYSMGPTYKGHDGSHEGPIATPVIAGERVFGLDAWGKLFALDFATGKEIWTVDLAKSLDEKRKPFYGHITTCSRWCRCS